jgi:hypothetical protein
LSNPILQPWVREELRKVNQRALSAMIMFTPKERCWPIGVPGFLLYPVTPIYFLQTPKEVVMIWEEDHMARHVYLTDKHSPDVKPSWFGESIGHYENGDTLVVDTIGLNTRTFVDSFRTPHTEQLHVVERFRIVDGGKALEVTAHVDDPGAFTTTGASNKARCASRSARRTTTSSSTTTWTPSRRRTGPISEVPRLGTPSLACGRRVGEGQRPLHKHAAGLPRSRPVYPSDRTYFGPTGWRPSRAPRCKKVEGSCRPARCNPFQCTPGRGSLLPVQRLGGMTDAAAGFHRWARKCGGVAGGGAGAAASDAGHWVSRRSIR